MSLLAAFQFLTLLPIKRNFTTRQIARSTVFFPIVGLSIGLLLAGVNWLLGLILPNAAVNVLLIVLMALALVGSPASPRLFTRKGRKTAVAKS